MLDLTLEILKIKMNYIFRLPIHIQHNLSFFDDN